MGPRAAFFVAPDKIATNIHVVAHPGPVFIKSPDKKNIWTVEGVTAFDVKNDLALLKIAGEDGTSSLLGDSDAVGVGDTVIATGYPGGTYKVTKGVVHRVRSNDKWLQMEIALSGWQQRQSCTRQRRSNYWCRFCPWKILTVMLFLQTRYGH